MSYLNRIRLVFSGQFQADVSTVNNDVRHFDNAAFQPSYQELQNRQALNGWWNPNGSGAFRLIGCTVRAVHYGDGTKADTPAQDPVIGLAVGGADDRTSGKIVDLDPQWQLASQLWGLQVRLLDDSGRSVLGGEYAVHAFRDLLFSRVAGSGGDGAASAYFQSALTGVAWSDAALGSRFLQELRQATQQDKVSIRLMTYGFQDTYGQPGFTFGTVSGVIGPYLEGEPESFVLGRRFTPAFGATSWNGINYFSGLLDGSGRLFLDLANALPLENRSKLLDIGELTVGTLLLPALPEGSPVGPASFQPIGTIPYRDRDWLPKTGGIAEFTLTPAQRGNQPPNSTNPLALVVRRNETAVPLLAICESANGLFVGAEPFVHRIDAGGPRSTSSTTFYAAAYGVPLNNAQVQLAQSGAMPGLGGSGLPVPPVPIPVAGIPEEALSFPAEVTTGADGTATITIASSPPNNPRGYIDGQLYTVTYQLAGQTRQAFAPFDVLAIHLRDAYPVPDAPTWAEHIAPIFIQYGNLYPIMSKRLVNLNDPASVYAHRELLTLAFSRHIHDPNYMPVTRDLSENKQQTILKWLKGLDDPGADPAFLAAVRAAEAPAALVSDATAPPPAEPAEPASGKTTFARSLAQARRPPA